MEKSNQQGESRTTNPWCSRFNT